MSKIAMIGGKTSSIGFRTLGVDIFPVPVPEEALEVWQKIPVKDYGVIFMTEPIYEELREQVLEIRGELTPSVLVIPAVTGPLGVSRRELNQLVEKALGTDILTAEE